MAFILPVRSHHKSVLLETFKRTSQLSEHLGLDLALRSQNILLTTPSLSYYERSNQVYPAAGSHNNHQVCKRYHAVEASWTPLRLTGSDRLSCLQLGTMPCVCSFPLGTVSAPDCAKKGIYSSQGRPEAQCGRCGSEFCQKICLLIKVTANILLHDSPLFSSCIGI